MNTKEIESIVDPAFVRTTRANEILFNKMKNLICKNQDIKLIRKNLEDADFEYELKNFGCDGERAYGSSYCAGCSLMHKTTGLQYPFTVAE